MAHTQCEMKSRWERFARIKVSIIWRTVPSLCSIEPNECESQMTADEKMDAFRFPFCCAEWRIFLYTFFSSSSSSSVSIASIVYWNRFDKKISDEMKSNTREKKHTRNWCTIQQTTKHNCVQSNSQWTFVARPDRVRACWDRMARIWINRISPNGFGYAVTSCTIKFNSKRNWFRHRDTDTNTRRELRATTVFNNKDAGEYRPQN